MWKSALVMKCRKNGHLSKTVRRESTQPARLLVMQHLMLPYTLDDVPMLVRLFLLYGDER